MDIPVTKFFVRTPKPRPHFYTVAEFLWGEGVSIDSDGDCAFPDDRTWTELTAERRTGDGRVDVDPVSTEPLTLVVRSSSSELAARTAYYLARYTDGMVAESADSEFLTWRAFESRLGQFDFESSFRRVCA